MSHPMVSNQQLSTIEYLAIDHSCTYNKLSTIMSYTPQLHCLHLFNAIDFRTDIRTILPITLSNLTDISIPIGYLKFHEFEILIKKIYAKLKILRVTIQSQDITFLNVHQWEQLILSSLPQLEEFYLRYIERFDRNYYYPGESNQFISLFWIERQWTFEIEIDHESIEYSVRPYRKRWTITYINSDDFKKSMMINITYILTVAQIYHLEIAEENVHIDALIEVVSLLPELTTLKIRSLSLYESKILNSEELITLSSMEDASKITKVYVETINDIEEFYFLLELFPYIKYLKVDYIKRIDFKFVLRYIFKEIKDDSNEYLRLLCFRIPTVDDEMIKKLKRMINLEKLLWNYTIKLVVENLYLEWQ